MTVLNCQKNTTHLCRSKDGSGHMKSLALLSLVIGIGGGGCHVSDLSLSAREWELGRQGQPMDVAPWLSAPGAAPVTNLLGKP